MALRKATANASLHAYLGWRRDMAAPGNWRACVAFLDRAERGRFSPSARGDERSGGIARGDERRPDLSRLSDEQLRCLEALYSEGEEEGER